MVYTWAADTRPLMEEETYRKYFEQAPKWRQEKAERIRFWEDRALSIGAWILYEKARKEAGFSERNVFNLSHSGHYVLCSIAEDEKTRTGCDLEMTGVYKEKLAKRFFCASEWEYIEKQKDEEAKREAFFRLWVLKESFMKATRLGMKLPLDAFEFGLWDAARAKLIRQPASIRGVFYFQEYDIKEKRFHAAVCSDSPDIEERLRWISF